MRKRAIASAGKSARVPALRVLAVSSRRGPLAAGEPLRVRTHPDDRPSKAASLFSDHRAKVLSCGRAGVRGRRALSRSLKARMAAAAAHKRLTSQASAAVRRERWRPKRATKPAPPQRNKPWRDRLHDRNGVGVDGFVESADQRLHRFKSVSQSVRQSFSQSVSQSARQADRQTDRQND